MNTKTPRIMTPRIMTPKTNQVSRARNIAATLGTYRAARYLASRGWSVEAARFILLGAA